MNYLNLEVTVLHAPEYIGSKPVQRGTWLNVMLWCAQQENAGRIVDAAKWSCRQWQQTCGVMKREVHAAPELLNWEGDDLAVWGYPLGMERTVLSRRATALLNGLTGGRPPQHKPTMVPTLEPTSESVKKGKVKKEEGNGNTGPAEAIYEAYPRRQAKQDALKAIQAAMMRCAPQQLLDRTQAYATATKLWPEVDRKFIPYPATWFNQGCYDDDPATWKRVAPNCNPKPDRINFEHDDYAKI